MSDNRNERNFRIADAMNTHIYALNILHNKGYKIFIYPDPEEDSFGDYWAIKDKNDFIASDPVKLLGLINIREALGNDWQSSSIDEKLHDKILGLTFPDNGYESYSDTDFDNLKIHLKVFFEAIRISMPENATRTELAKFMNSYYK